jgi:hypothetical protein
MGLSNDLCFPITPHLRGSRGTNDDTFLDLATTQRILSSRVLVQEKLDGINLGVGVTRRGELIFVQKDRLLEKAELLQLGDLDAWFARNRLELVNILGLRFILFGEYLPGSDFDKTFEVPWALFDCYDRVSSRFISQSALKARTRQLGLAFAPILFDGQLHSISFLEKLIGRSHFGDHLMEGIYLRLEEREFLKERYKFVRRDYTK